ncbi:[Fe-Fe] hydrogenase large subunit C-terminal domain-containing protein [Zhaonella formicivorans]|uniref:[Fe-Fe] hydrogenase large subunit C-terminal domain-containing protein n=1 Tax=Zhaonella formicivorans TaxID=2528593 RepID=UPI0010EB16C4|nr:[Fe-Fe] hydrogenase large subunit C-terminal domain-containing protein [Zhaonella formicivorans]
MRQYFHSVRLDKDKCKGCTNCIKRCPTEAIRVRDGKAQIIEERCIDCGECIRICPNNAKFAEVDHLTVINNYKYTVALPAPALYGQFKEETPGQIDQALLALGFDAVVEVPFAAELVTAAIAEFLKGKDFRKPLISSACPAVVGLIQVRFPLLTEQIIPIETPMAIAAKLAKRQAQEQFGLKPEEVGTFFITPCPAKATVVRQPQSNNPYKVDGAIAINEIYGELQRAIKRVKEQDEAGGIRFCYDKGIGWGRAGGEIAALGGSGMLSVDGIRNVIDLLEEVERGELNNLLYLECQACAGGCVGGPLVVKNPFVAKARLEHIIREAGSQTKSVDQEHLRESYHQGFYKLVNLPEARRLSPLDEDLTRAIQKMGSLEQIVETLPGLDCGSCGSPTCRALAEDIVRGLAYETDCTFVLREKVQAVAEEVLELAKKVPPVMGKNTK